MTEPPPTFLPRVFCIPDPTATVAAVLQRRPGKWWRVGRWDWATGAYEAGAWFSGSLYPQRCDLSPGGRWFCYFAFKSESDWPAGECYTAVSRLPWLRALAAWREIGTYSRGFTFDPDPAAWEVGPPTVGAIGPCWAVCGLRFTDPAQFAVERRRGWRESASTPPRDLGDVWDQHRDVTMEKSNPVGGKRILSVSGRFEAFRECPNSCPPQDSPYTLARPGRAAEPIPGVQWADWTAAGHLAVATWGGYLQLRDASGSRVLSEVWLPEGEPAPHRAPDWAGEW